MCKYDFYIRGGNCVQAVYDPVTDSYSLCILDAKKFQTAVEAIVIPFRILKGEDGRPVEVPGSLHAGEAATLLASPEISSWEQKSSEVF